MPTTQRCGFTLIELIVVLVVIAALGYVLRPVFDRPRPGSAQRSQCQLNLKKIALAFQQYLRDNDDRFPLVFVRSASGPKPPHGWADALLPYTKSTQVFQCPSDTNAASTVPATPGFTDYFYNANFVRAIWRGSRPLIIGANQSMLGSPRQTILIGEGGNSRGAVYPSTYNQCGDGKVLTGGQQTCSRPRPGLAVYPSAQIHLGGAHFLFADSSIKWIKSDNASQSAQVLNNGAGWNSRRQKSTFSLLNLP